MDRVELRIYYREGNETKLRCTVNKWKFQDTMMGEQFITLNITSEVPIDFAVGDFCTFRGETFTLNYVPSVTQTARTNERQDSYTYENVKFESFQEELTRCLMLDITPTTGDYVAALGTNYTGSSKFQLFCGETSANGSTLTAVCALAAKMQANLDRMFPTNGWKIFVDTTSTYLNSAGVAVLVTHTEDKVLTFDNTTVAKALEEVHNTFDLDYCVRGRSIYIGYNLKNLTSDNDNETFAFGYGKGYPTRESQNKALFQIKRIANSQQKVVTRLRALGSTKNMPYRYYNSKYNLSQSLFPTNLQLPDTFATPAVKATNNALRDNTLRAVKGDTNDAYIDKNDDAEHCAEGVREDSARWDGTNSELPEIYPTIEEATYGELRSALVQDQDGQTGVSSFPNYGASERIDKMLAIGYKDGNTLVDDANKGDGILPESGISARGIPRSADIGLTSLSYNTRNFGDFSSRGGVYAGPERTLFTIQGVSAGKYAMAPTIGAVLYGFSISCYRDGVSADVGYIITVKQKNLQTGSTTTIATYTSDYQSISRGDGILEMELPEIPDVKNGANAKVSEVRITALSDITVTFTPIMRNIHVPSGFTDNFSLSYKVGNSRLDHTVTYDPEYNWIPLDDTDSVSETFHVFIQDMGFDLQACWTDDTPVVAMKSGRCVGREFEIGENIEKVTHNGKKGYMLTLKRATDNTLNTYYPSATDPIVAGDYFVLLNISMPDVYVKMAEVRLLRAATEYLADNCETQFTYQPSIDDIYLQRNYDNMVKAGTPQSSIFWRLYAGLKFTFRGIPASEDSPAPLADITIEQVSISMGEGLTPKVELKLNDDVQQSTIQKLTTSVDRIYNGSIFSSGSGSGANGGGAMSAALLSILQSEGEKLFLSKKHDDVAEGKITFNDVVTHNETLKAKRGLRVGNFNSRLLGSGALIDEEGNAEFESIYSRNFISTPEFRFNRVNVTEGEQWCTNGYGTIKEVEIIDETTGYITLKLEENDYASIAEGDICRGIYNDIAHEYETASLDDDTALYAGENESNVEGFGFSSKEGFFTSYFWVRQMITNQKGECKFLYELRNTNTPHPCEFMKFAQYGSFTNSERRSSSYATSIGHYYEMVLDGVSTWKIKSANVVYRKGYLGNMTVTLKNGNEAELQGYGLYVQDNVYFGNAVVQLDPETIADLQDALNSYIVDFSGYVDVITVDDVGNVIGGLYTISGEAPNEYLTYRIHSAITVRKSGELLTIAADNADAGIGTYKIYAQSHGCSFIIENSTIYITGIDNIKNGVAGSADDANFDFAAMRAMDSCSVDLIIDCEGKGSIVKSFPVTIKHDSQPFVGADISNEFSAVSWNTKTQSYVGLPIVFDMKIWHNNESLDIAAVVNVVLTAATAGVTLVNGTAPVTPASTSIYYTKEIITSNGHKFARITLTAMGKDVPSVIDLDLTCTAVYSGISYDRTLRHTIKKSTDTNVYSLLPSHDAILYNKNTNSLSTNNVTCSVICDSSDDKHYTIGYSDFATHNIVLYYRRFYTDGTSDATETLYNNTAVPVANNISGIRFYLYGLTNGAVDRTIFHDSEEVSVIAEGLDGLDAISYYLTSSINSIIRDQYGNYAGTARPVITAWKKVGDNAAVRLADISTPSVAEGFTINAYEMNGSTTAYTNTSTTGVLTCAQPYANADRLEVELVKSGVTYSTMSIPIITEHQGDAGADGVFPRDCGLFDTDIATNQTFGYAGYIYRKVGDVVIRDMVRYEIGGVMYGFMVKTKSSTTLVTAAPTSASGDANWESTGIVKTVIANTIFGTNANIGGFMASNQRLISSNIAYRIVYKGSYDSTTEYGEVIESNIYQRQMVLYNSEYWVVRGGVESFTGQTPAENSQYWRKTTIKELAVEKALDSYVDILSFRIDGIQNEIEMIASDDSTWSVDKNGIQTLGIINGRRVVLDPLSREIDIYNESGALVTALTGDTYTDLSEIFGSSSGSFTLSAVNKTGSRNASNIGSQTNLTNGSVSVGTIKQTVDDVTTEYATTSSCRVSVVGTLRAMAYSTPYSGGGSTLIQDCAPVDANGNVIHHAAVYLYIKTYRDSSYRTLVATKLVASVRSDGDGIMTRNVNAQVDVPAGYQKIVVSFENTVYPTTTNTSTETYWNISSASFVSDLWLSRLFANGLAYGSSQNNFFALLNIASKIIMQAVTTDSSNKLYGFSLDTDGFKVQRKNITGKVFPTIFYGLVSWTATDTFSLTSYYSFDGNSPTISRLAEGSYGKIKLTFPSSWNSLGLGFSAAIVNLVGYNDSCRNVHVTNFTSGSITIEGNDDPSNNFTSFAIEIKYIG